MIVTIKDFKEVEETSQKSGKKYTATIFTGMQKGYKGAPDTPWEKKLLNFKHGDFIDTLKEIGVGGQALIKSEKQNGFWEIISVERYGAGGGGKNPTPPKTDKKSPGAQQEDVPVPTGGGVPVIYHAPAAPGDSKYLGCLRVASDLIIKSMEQSENFKNLIKRTATPELVKQMVVDFANHFYANDPDKIQKDVATDEGMPEGSPDGGDAPPSDDIPI